MPSMGGLELLSKIRADFNPVPFVLLTGYGDVDNYQKAVKLNATDFLEKPFDLLILTSTMQRAITYGYELILAERKIDKIYRDLKLPEEKIEEINSTNRTVMAMRIDSDLYSNKKS